MHMNQIPKAIGATAVAAVVFVGSWALLTRKATDTTAPHTASRLLPNVPPQPAPQPAPQTGPHALASTAQAPTHATATKDNGDLLKTSKDYWGLALQTLPRARAGDPKAQYLMWQIHVDCHSGLAMLIDRGRIIPLDEALSYAREYNIPVEEATLEYNRCIKFYTQDPSVFGKPTDWLERATKAGVPMAEAETAQLLVAQEMLKRFSKPGSPPIENPLAGPISSDDDAKTLLRKATAQGDPNALFILGTLQAELNPGESATAATLDFAALKYLACTAGADCSHMGERIPVNCNPSGNGCVYVPEEIMKSFNNDITPIIRRAEEINTALKSQQWDKVPGLGS